MAEGILSISETALLQGVYDHTAVMAGFNGTKIYGGLTARTGLYFKILSIREDATAFTSLVCTNGVTTLGASNFLIGATTLKGDQLIAPAGFHFTAFELSAGSLIAT